MSTGINARVLAMPSFMDNQDGDANAGVQFSHELPAVVRGGAETRGSRVVMKKCAAFTLISPYPHGFGLFLKDKEVSLGYEHDGLMVSDLLDDCSRLL